MNWSKMNPWRAGVDYPPPRREWQCCPVCAGSGKLYDPIMGMGSAGATMTCHRCTGTGTIERP